MERILFVKDDMGEEKEIRIGLPEGYMIDRENSTLECIKLKPVKSKFSDYDGTYRIEEGWGIKGDCVLHCIPRKNDRFAKDVFATEKIAKSALAMAQISQIMANDKRFGGMITEEEWKDELLKKFVIDNTNKGLFLDAYYIRKYFLAFHTMEQRDLFLKENEQLVRDYLMID